MTKEELTNRYIEAMGGRREAARQIIASGGDATAPEPTEAETIAGSLVSVRNLLERLDFEDYAKRVESAIRFIAKVAR